MSNSDSRYFIQKGSFLNKSRIFATFRFNAQYAFPESGKCFSLRKCQIRIFHMFLPLKGSFPKKIFENFFTWVLFFLYCVVAPGFFYARNPLRTLSDLENVSLILY